MSNFVLEHDYSQVNKLVSNMLNKQKLQYLLHDIGRVMKADTGLNFRAQKSPDGRPWNAISRPGQILRDTGRLRNSIVYQLEGSDAVKIGTNVEYAKAHQFGFKGPVDVKGHTRLITQAFGKKLAHPVYQTVGPHQRYMRLPARPFLGIGPRASKKIEKAIEAWGERLPE